MLPEPVLCGGETDLLEALVGWAPPRRILAVTHERSMPVNLRAHFPGATIRHERLGPDLSEGWADLLWLQFALSSRRVDPARVLPAAGRALTNGALIAVVDLVDVPDPSMKVRLREDADLDPDRDTRAVVRKTFATLCCIETRHPIGWWRSYALLGARHEDLGR